MQPSPPACFLSLSTAVVVPSASCSFSLVLSAFYRAAAFSYPSLHSLACRLRGSVSPCFPPGNLPRFYLGYILSSGLIVGNNTRVWIPDQIFHPKPACQRRSHRPSTSSVSPLLPSRRSKRQRIPRPSRIRHAPGHPCPSGLAGPSSSDDHWEFWGPLRRSASSRKQPACVAAVS